MHRPLPNNAAHQLFFTTGSYPPVPENCLVGTTSYDKGPKHMLDARLDEGSNYGMFDYPSSLMNFSKMIENDFFIIVHDYPSSSMNFSNDRK